MISWLLTLACIGATLTLIATLILALAVLLRS